MYIHVLVTAGAKKESFSPRLSQAGQANSDDHFEISVKEKAQRNEANTRVLELIALHFKIPKNKIRIVNGHKHPSKLLVIEEN
jgi:uncharacterized protein YggU (UPF0235/DUF167 family)